ncbi:unnamed protein product [Rotaria sordida]|uniref:PIPK domain-containing protein n=1 Tax=Rotaria sordida TaxID=392033 RepID=A0A814XD87_9BILA|nr:unnamed protein product [Rotaria sordida]
MTDDLQDAEGVDIGKKHKLGHLRVDTQGNATFKRLPTNQLVEALQLGIQYSVGGLEATPAHDVLYQDFLTVEIIHFPKGGRTTPKATPPHRFNDFTIRSYAPVAFRHFREKFNIKPEDYLSSICKPFRELKNPGASGSLFYLTSDDEFIIKTVQKKEAEFLKTLLPGYYMNVTQNQRTLLPKFFGLYCYQVTEFLRRNKNGSGDNKNIRITVMNNLIPSHIQMHEKYDLKGSTFKRRANIEERRKESPTWKDLDFMEHHPNGLLLDSDTFAALAKTVERDCRVLESFHIMDYSFLIGVHHASVHTDSPRERRADSSVSNDPALPPSALRRMYSTPMANIQAEFEEHNKPDDDHLAKTGGIPALTTDGQRLYLYVGIIDILQSYQLRKRLEHRVKSVITDGSQISVTHPSYYSERFQKFLFNTVFRKPSPRLSKSGTIIGLKQTANNYYTNLPSNQTSSIKSLNGISYSIPSKSVHSSSSSSAETTNSHSIPNGTSRQSDQRTIHGSSTTFYASSHQSDSLYNEPTYRTSGRVLTTKFDNNHTNISRMKFYRDLSTPPVIDVEKRRNLLTNDRNVGKKFSPSTTNLSYRSNLSEYSSEHHQQNHQSSEEITRL